MPQTQLSPISDDRFEYLVNLSHQSNLQESLHYFSRKIGLSLDGAPFSFKNHEYLEEPYREIAKAGAHEIIDEKAAQMGISTREILNAFHGAKYGRYPKGVLYLLPSKTDVTEFSKGKAQGILDENPSIASWITDTDTANIKRVGSSLIYFRGMQSKIGLKTISVDLVVFDEIEEVEDWTMVELAERRMDHSEVEYLGQIIRGGIIHRLSVPSIPGYGIDAFFAGKMNDQNSGWEIEPSDQRYWLLTCQHCGEDNCLEDDFPDCLVETSAKDQKAIRICHKCKRELDISKGRWVAKDPDRRVRGYHYSQLFSAYVNPWKILDQFRKKRELTTLYNDKLGIPYVEAEARLEVNEVLALCGSSPQLISFEGPAAMGIDQPKEEGGKFHVTIAYKASGMPCNIVLAAIRNTWAELSDLMDQFNVARCVVDGLPDQAKARAWAESHAGKVFLCYYAEKQKGPPRWKEDDWTVSVDRTEIHNTITRAVHENHIHLPRRDVETLLFAKHLHSMARKKEEDKDSGSIRHVWVKTGADHFRHSLGYCWLALQEIGEWYKRKEMPKERKIESSWRVV